MIRVSVLYPSGEGKTFNHDYYRDSHFKMVQNQLGPLGLVRCEIEKGLGTAEPGAPAPFMAIGAMYFETMEAVQAAFANSDGAMADVPNFTNIEPMVQISEVVE